MLRVSDFFLNMYNNKTKIFCRDCIHYDTTNCAPGYGRCLILSKLYNLPLNEGFFCHNSDQGLDWDYCNHFGSRRLYKTLK